MKHLQFRAQANWRRSRRGQTLAEYALIIAFIAVVAISTLELTGGQVSATFTTVTNQLTTASLGGATSGGHMH